MRHHLALALPLLTLLAPSPGRADEPYRAVQELLTTGTTVVGEPLRYPAGKAELKAQVISLRPGESTARHGHPVPLFAYLLEGELTVDYGSHGTKVYRAGDALLEAMAVEHQGKNTGAGPVRILAVFLGVEGQGTTAPAAAAR